MSVNEPMGSDARWHHAPKKQQIDWDLGGLQKIQEVFNGHA